VPAPTPLAGYAPYKNLPPLAGLCSLDDAMKPGLPVEECVRRLKRIHYAFVRLHGLLTARITAEPIYELKTAFAHHAYLCAEHATAIRTRVGEMREPPLGLEEVPHPALEAFFDEIRAAPTTIQLLSGAYRFAIASLSDAITRYIGETHPLTDAPSRRLLRFTQLEVDDMMRWGQEAFRTLLPDMPLTDEQHDDWAEYLGSLLTAAGWMDGTEDVSNEPVVRRYSAKPFEYDPVPQRDERFEDLWNQGVNAEAFLYSDEYPARAKAVMMLFKRLREIDVPEMMASILAQTPGKPWGYYRDMSRQLWDEARHAMMGEVGFVALGVDWTQARVTYNWSYRLNTECSPIERHAVLFFIEQGLMPRTGKRYEYETARDSGVPLIATIQDFDWADEVLHSQIGRQWLVPDLGGLQAALRYGDECWSRILSNWTTVRERGLTRHENWWPGVYAQACRAAGEEPDPRSLAFAETYEAKRADVHRGIPAE
jgi:hypothetical protein